jgi:hypothetical protein
MKRLITLFSPTFYHFIFLRSKYSQHPVLIQCLAHMKHIALYLLDNIVPRDHHSSDHHIKRKVFPVSK